MSLRRSERITTAIAESSSLDTLPATMVPTRKRNYQGLKSFYLFPRLPTELQLMIWKYAMGQRNADQVLLPVEISRNTSPVGPRCLFTASTQWTTRCHKWSRGMFTKNGGTLIISGLSMANFQSREVFLKTLPKTLHTPNGGLIRYNPHNTVIQLTGAGNRAFIIDVAIVRAIAADSKRGLWPLDILHLGLTQERKYNSLSKFKRFNIQTSLPNLKNFVVIPIFDLTGLQEHTIHALLRPCRTIQFRLDNYEATLKDYKAPKVSAIDSYGVVREIGGRFSSQKLLELSLEDPKEDTKAASETSSAGPGPSST